jgi:hypothetical protein
LALSKTGMACAATGAIMATPAAAAMPSATADDISVTGRNL